MQPIDEGAVVILFRKLIEEIRVLQHVRNGVLGIADKNHRRFGTKRFNAA